MYNTDMPTRAKLPTTRKLLRSTAIAAVSATAILVAVVLPAEYGIDPTGVGSALNLTEMGEIKTQLAAEAEADAADRQRDGGDGEPGARLAQHHDSGRRAVGQQLVEFAGRDGLGVLGGRIVVFHDGGT